MVVILDNKMQHSVSPEDEPKPLTVNDERDPSVIPGLSRDTEMRTREDVTIGGPYSAFSGLVRPYEASNLHFMHGIRENFLFKPQFQNQLLPPELCGRRSEFPADMPIAPAFAQIFQRRRRRENRPRRQRTTFTSDQTMKLELEYNRADYITRPRRFELAETLNLTESQIKIWFQNRRAKDKRIEKAHMDNQLRTMGYASIPGSEHMNAPHQSSCGVCAVPLPLPLPLGPIPWTTVVT